MDKQRKARAAERILFTMLVAALGVAGFAYERLRPEVPPWQLVGLICAGLFITYAAYRLALNIVLRNLKR
ncbi:hypothetical protein GON01_14850 [Sphingomonas sp. MAH-20]|uniref:Uncharacterized protein n=1 Tax=Sphingomonas horti TaxID=2682842 RepID=A0A6I4J3I5_9SPHN|nr:MULTISPECIES: hypothetical protein [Sphingomonas]MBA2919176.1 hypothetical protein [Sphingomonas sp. CGMCC 1.13658]MVO79209.1 hypothetical protein [Sphingomonas horti]